MLWEEKEAVFPYDAEKWIQKHIVGKVEKYVEARQHLPGYEDAPIGFRLGEANTPEFKEQVRKALDDLEADNPDLDLKLEWVSQ